MYLSTLTLTLTVTLAGAAPQGPSDRGQSVPEAAPAAQVLRHIPVREWMAASPRPLTPPLGSFLGRPRGREPFDLLAADASERRLLGPSSVMTLVRVVAPVEDDPDELTFRMQGSTLVATGTPDSVQLLESGIHQLTRAMVHNVQLVAGLYRVPDARSFPTTVGNGKLQALTSGLHQVWSGIGACQSGNVAGLGKELATTYVMDIDVEVAQDAKIGDPQTSLLFEGVRVSVEPHVLTENSDLVMLAQFSFGEQRAPMEIRDTGIDDMPSLDVPSVDCTSGTFAGRIESGGSLLLAVQGDAAGGGRMLLTLTARAVRGDSDVNDAVSAYPISALLTRALRATVRNADTDGFTEYPFRLDMGDEESRHLGSRDRDSLEDLLHRAMLPDDDARLWLLGGHAIVEGGSATRQKVAHVISGLQDQLFQNAAIEARTSLQAGQFGNGIFPIAGSEVTAAGGELQPLHHITLPALVGYPHVVVRGHETTSVRDIDVEIAQKASISDPIIDKVFSGVIMSMYVYPQQTGAGAEIDIDLLHTPSLVRRPGETKDGGDLYLPAAARAHFSHSGPISSGQDLILGEGPTVQIGNERYRTDQRARITLR